MDPDRAALIRYRLDQAEHALLQARNLRQRSDYGELVPATEQEGRAVLSNAGSFIEAVRTAVDLPPD
ncbi:MAG: hypothetical protein FJ087_14025 [Deltaproteobacteria bacterium]|nr:hypothetical protein [Deltaproteobacteria bacterium]